ncbi:RNA recognition motif domain-containing protein [Hirsutella rhossiliensis]|uniref:RNA recognition motif domain-containing protein n=1 Tax=Hirsutella rhossiliensis TaxID=111463 RepID=A0A9P8MZ16_9HYPO|nr:RNA recognition motif domain-containing protein [Hirsutella rhossiliensis]KAH0963910.1 RNA recognition motif domain-containing protein [Hirsutella rhossiliensis]
MASRSPSRGRYQSRTHSVAPRSADGRRRRYDSRSPSRSPTPPPRRNGRYRSGSRSARGRDSREPSELPPPLGTKVVVERLSKNIREAHLREIFGRYGPIQDLDLPMNRTFGTNRGTAYILYQHREDAEEAIAHMHEGQIDGAVIHVSIVLPRRIFSPDPPLARRGANIDPRVPLGPSRGGRGPRGFPGRYGPRPSASPPRGPRGRGGGFRQRSTSYDSYSSRSRSKSPPPRRGAGGSRLGDGPRRRSPSYDSYADRNRSNSPRRAYR